jgi:hypothetical protein
MTSSSSSSIGRTLTLVIPALLSLVVSIVGGVTVFRINDKKTDLNYSVVTSAVFSGQTQNTAIVGVVINNPAQKELENVRVIVPLGNAKLTEPKVIGLQPGSYTQVVDAKQIEIQVPYLNPQESFSLQLLLALSSNRWNINNSSVSVRAKGITAIPTSSTARNDGVLEVLVPAVTSVLALLVLAFSRSPIFSPLFYTRKHGSDQRDVVAYILGVYEFYQEAAQIRTLERKTPYWALTDSLAEKCLSSGDHTRIQQGIQCLTSLLSYADIPDTSQLLIHYNLARLAAAVGDLKLARNHLELARKGNHSVINMRISFDKNLSQIV